VGLVKELSPSFQAAVSPAIGAVVRSRYVRDSVTEVLYEAIFAFLQSADIIGNILATNPILGPVRNLAIQLARDQIDQTAGVLIKEFLASYSDQAVDRLASIVTAERNREAFAGSWSAALDAALMSPVIIPSLSKQGNLEILASFVEGGGVQKVAEGAKKAVQQASDAEAGVVTGSKVDDDEHKERTEALLKNAKEGLVPLTEALLDVQSIRLYAFKVVSEFLESPEGKAFLKDASAA